MGLEVAPTVRHVEAALGPGPGLSKWLEVAAKYLAGWVGAILLWRVGRRRRARALLTPCTRVVLCRFDSRVGEALLMTPLIEALSQHYEVDVVVHPKCRRVLEGHPGVHSLMTVGREELWGSMWSRTARARLRDMGAGAVVINCSSWEDYSAAASFLARLIAARGCLVASRGGPNRLLADVTVSPRADTVDEVWQRLQLLSPVRFTSTRRLTFREPKPRAAFADWHARLPVRYAVINPGGRLGWRRAAPQVYAATARMLLDRGICPVVFWGPDERALAEDVVRYAPGAVVAAESNLDELAFALRGSQVAVCCNSGPMHLAVAVGAPTVGVFVAVDPARWGHSFAPHQMVLLDESADDAAHSAAVCRAAECVLETASSGVVLNSNQTGARSPGVPL